MGILNLTPDSFSDGGRFNTETRALKQVRKLIRDGVDIIDIGGESTGPNSKNVSLKEELARVIPILKKIRKITKIPISIDTYKADVARQALEAGANIINDVTALRGDKNMAKVAAKYNCPIILMYSKDSTPRTTRSPKKYRDVIKTIKGFWKARVAYATKNGIKRKNIILDPGMGAFVSGIADYSFEIVTRLNELTNLGFPVLIGLSRKSFLGGTIKERDKKAITLTTIAVLNGVSIIRTHHVHPNT